MNLKNEYYEEEYDDETMESIIADYESKKTEDEICNIEYLVQKFNDDNKQVHLKLQVDLESEHPYNVQQYHIFDDGNYYYVGEGRFCKTGSECEQYIKNVANEISINKKRLFVDMDGTLAQFHQVDTLEKLYEPGYFENLEPMQNIVQSVNELVENKDIDVYILSAVLENCNGIEQKNNWLDKYMSNIDNEHRIFSLCGIDKTKSIEGGIKENDFLLDDYTKNLTEWEAAGGTGIKMLNGINNTHGTWQGKSVKFNDISLSENILNNIQGDKKENTLKKEMGQIVPNELKQLQKEMSEAKAEKYEDVLPKPGDIISVPTERGRNTYQQKTLFVLSTDEDGIHTCLAFGSKNQDEKNDKRYTPSVKVKSGDKNYYIKCDEEIKLDKNSVMTISNRKISDEEYNGVLNLHNELKEKKLVREVSLAVPINEVKMYQDKVNEIINCYKDNPEMLAEYIAFKSKFYKYSSHNQDLIGAQNSNTTFVASFKSWKDLGYPVKKDEHGIKILVPHIIETFYRDDEEVNVRFATSDEKLKIANGTIKTNEHKQYIKGNVFDISQTTCPQSDYPQVYNMGYASVEHSILYDNVKEFAEQSGFIVTEKDLNSISLNGYCDIENREIVVNNRLNDSEKLTTSLHELAHGILHTTSTQESSVKEFEAESLACMLESRYGLEVSNSTKSYIANNYKNIKNKDFKVEDCFKRMEKAFKYCDNGITKQLEANGISEEYGINKKQQHKPENKQQINTNFLQEV